MNETKPDFSRIDRRQFIIGTTLSGSALVLGLTACAPTASRGPKEVVEFTPLLSLDTHGGVAIICPSGEMGQNVMTTLAACVAEELDVDWETVAVELAPNGKQFGLPPTGNQATGNSNSVRSWAPIMRQMGAAARHILVAEAAERWQADAGSLRTEEGVVVGGDGQRLEYGELAQGAALRTPPQEPPLKAAADFKFLTHSLPRKGVREKVTGAPMFGIDVKLEGQLYAAVRRAPAFGQKVESFDTASVPELNGLQGVHIVDGAVAAVADDWWTAKRALDAVDVQLGPNPLAAVDDTSISAQLYAAASDAGRLNAQLEGDPEAVIAAAEKKIDVTYEMPYLAHAAMEPMACLAQVTEEGAELWMGNQHPGRMAGFAAKVLEIPEDRIHINNAYMGGAFGRRSVDDGALRQALLLARQLARPVQVIWEREEDTRQDYYRPSTLAIMKGALAEDGSPAATSFQVAGSSLVKQLYGAPLRDGIDGFTVYPYMHHPYSVPQRRVDYGFVHSDVPIGWWRAVSASNAPFMTESFFDELAHLAGQDPLQYRDKLLADQPRLQRVLRRAGELAGWPGPSPRPNEGWGVAAIAGFGSFCAQVAKVVVVDGKLTVERIVSVVDCGVVLDPSTVEAQVQGAVIYGLSATLWGEINIREGGVVQSNFHDYRVVRMDETPEMQVEVIASEEASGGVGELGLPCVAPAVANAVFAATGKRHRTVPLAPLLEA